MDRAMGGMERSRSASPPPPPPPTDKLLVSFASGLADVESVTPHASVRTRAALCSSLLTDLLQSRPS